MADLSLMLNDSGRPVADDRCSKKRTFALPNSITNARHGLNHRLGLPDNLVGLQQNGLRDGDAQGLGGLEIDDDLAFGRLLPVPSAR